MPHIPVKAMKTFSFVMLLLVLSPASSVVVLHNMYDRYHNHWHKTFHFIQETERYRNDSLIKKETWYEAMYYPDLFRIDLGDPSLGNAYICNKDSVWIFKNGQITRRTNDVNELVFMLGGMYFYPFDSVPAHFREMGYALDKYHNSTWHGKPVYVVGADKDDEQVNQLWVDKDKLVALRFIKYDDGVKTEGLLEDHIELDGAWTETKAEFYRNGHLIQVERYHDCVANDSIDKRVFDPALFGKYHWYKK